MPASSLFFDNDDIWVSRITWDGLCNSVSVIPLHGILGAATEVVKYGGKLVIYRDEDEADRFTIDDPEMLRSQIEKIRSTRNQLGLSKI